MSSAFIILEEVLEIHDDQIARYGGASGILDLRLLESALVLQTMLGGAYLHTDLSEMATACFSYRSESFVSFVRKTGKIFYMKSNLLIENKFKI